MKNSRYLDKGVYLVLAVWQDVAGVDVLDYVGACKLVKCIEVEVKGWQSKSLQEKVEWLHEFLRWLWMEGKKLSDGWRYVTEYVINTKVENEVKEVVEEYKRYVKQRFGKDIYLDLSDREVIKAAKVIQKVVSELNMSVYDVIRFQHECWEEIKEPLVFQRMSNEDLVKRRIKVKIEEDKKNSVVIGRSGSDRGSANRLEELVAKYWKTILSVGPMFYVRKKGWLAEIAREYWDRLQTVSYFERNELKKEYSTENIVRRWKEVGCPTNLLE